MMNARFEELAQDPDAPFVFAGSSTGALVRSADNFSRFAQAKEGHVPETITALVREITRVTQHGFLPSELARAAKAFVASTESEVAEWDKRQSSEMVEEIVRNFLANEQMPGRAAELAMARAMIPTITLDELNHLAATWGGEQGRVIAISGPASGKLPTEAQVLELVKSASAESMPAWKDDAGDKPLVAQPPAPGKVVKTATDPDTGATTWTLANGVKVIVKPTTFQNDEILFAGSQRGGSSLIADKDWPNARFAASIVDASGVGDFDPIQLHKLLADKVANVNVGLWDLSENVNGRTRPADLETALQLAYLKLTAPRKDLKAFGAWKAGEHEDLRNRLLSPERTFFDELRAVATLDHPRYRPETDDMIEKIDLDKALAVYKTRFADLGDMTFTFVGNLDLAKLQPLVETYLGGLPSKGRHEKWKDLNVKFPTGKLEKTFVHGTEPKSYVELEMQSPEKWTLDGQRDARLLAKVLSIRLREVLREDMGGVYGVQVWAGISREPKQNRTFTVFFGCDPDRVAELRKAVFDTVAAIKKDGTTPENLAKVTETMKRSRETDEKTNYWWMTQLADAAYWHEDLGKTTNLDAAIARVTNENLKAAAKKFFDADHYLFAVMKPEKK
jgi:zinc protease